MTALIQLVDIGIEYGLQLHGSQIMRDQYAIYYKFTPVDLQRQGLNIEDYTEMPSNYHQAWKLVDILMQADEYNAVNYGFVLTDFSTNKDQSDEKIRQLAAKTDLLIMRNLENYRLYETESDPQQKKIFQLAFYNLRNKIAELICKISDLEGSSTGADCILNLEFRAALDDEEDFTNFLFDLQGCVVANKGSLEDKYVIQESIEEAARIYRFKVIFPGFIDYSNLPQ